jgi:hypothetical protein
VCAVCSVCVILNAFHEEWIKKDEGVGLVCTS